MPYNKSERTDDKQNRASQKAESVTTKGSETAARPASLNGIPKQES